MFRLVVALMLVVPMPTASAADAEQGRVLAQRHCGVCHLVAPDIRNEVAVAAAFDVIGRKYDFDVARLSAAIRGPHPRMNFAPSSADASDIAAYIATLPK